MNFYEGESPVHVTRDNLYLDQVVLVIAAAPSHCRGAVGWLCVSHRGRRCVIQKGTIRRLDCKLRETEGKKVREGRREREEAIQTMYMVLIYDIGSKLLCMFVLILLFST